MNSGSWEDAAEGLKIELKKACEERDRLTTLLDRVAKANADFDKLEADLATANHLADLANKNVVGWMSRYAAETARVRVLEAALEEVLLREGCPDARDTGTMGPFMLAQALKEARAAIDKVLE